MEVALLTEYEKDSLVGQLVQPNWYFNPTQDCNDNWVISTEEINSSIYPEHEWIKSMPLIEWCEPVQPPSGSTIN
jgi:hypothetical protein